MTARDEKEKGGHERGGDGKRGWKGILKNVNKIK